MKQSINQGSGIRDQRQGSAITKSVQPTPDGPLIPAVKICGLTNLEDAVAAARAGADYLGFVFAPSPRRVDPIRAREFWPDLPYGVPKVGVFKGQTLDEVERVLDLVLLDYLQFQGVERPAFCRVFGLPVIRAIPARSESDLRMAEAYFDVAELLLVDLPKDGDQGMGIGGQSSGAGDRKDRKGVMETLPEGIVRAALRLPKPVFLAGGLTPDNVGMIVERFHPFGIDVARGVESAPGVKDHELMRRFALNAKGSGIGDPGSTRPSHEGPPTSDP